ncbi:MAG: YHYH protein [Flammeovirgaceae bacterium]|jgi:hypothetical protein|nr:YHYH protein [Flammeovirgaceae bacterium]
MKKNVIFVICIAWSLLFLANCNNDDEITDDFDQTETVDDGATDEDTETEDDGATDEDTETEDDDAIESVWDAFYNVENIYIQGDYVYINTFDLPDHVSAFYPEDDSLYAAYDGDNGNFSTTITAGGQTFDPEIAAQNYTFKIPINPVVNTSHQSTSGGPIGVALNGVVIYNQYNGAGTVLDDLEFNNTDQYNGHPTPNTGGYHYHIEPTWLTRNDPGALIGFLLDGFPIYGPVEEGVELFTADLDDYHGHTAATAEYPDGIYHYHATSDAPWINGDGYWGTPGTVSQ